MRENCAAQNGRQGVDDFGMMRQRVKIFEQLNLSIYRREFKVAGIGVGAAAAFLDIAAVQQPAVFLANLQHLPADAEQWLVIEQVSEKQVTVFFETFT